MKLYCGSNQLSPQGGLMNTTTSGLSRNYIIYQIFKYTIYGFLTYNMYVFFEGELSSSAQTFRNGINLEDIILAFSASIDSLAWIILLVVFELETAIIDDDTLKGPLFWVLLGVKTFSYVFIIYAAYGYIARTMFISDTSAFHIADACSLIGTSFTYIVTLDDYVPITEAACQVLNNAPLVQINGTEIIGTVDAITDAQRLGWVDIINSNDWLLIVAILEVDVYLQLHDKLTGRVYKISQAIKPLLYLVLFINAVYWGFKGDLVDFWDAVLWLLAFFFIEMNIFQWHEEKEEEKEEAHKLELAEGNAND
ncbi:MAG: hypothetical protein DRQ47_07670 [Gammaproteobacteria bacterium]|nr:MAG: hypothetical protein DRQ47_07670 [Gammaproteobacteria bacterium]